MAGGTSVENGGALGRLIGGKSKSDLSYHWTQLLEARRMAWSEHPGGFSTTTNFDDLPLQFNCRVAARRCEKETVSISNGT